MYFRKFLPAVETLGLFLRERYVWLGKMSAHRRTAVWTHQIILKCDLLRIQSSIIMGDSIIPLFWFSKGEFIRLHHPCISDAPHPSSGKAWPPFVRRIPSSLPCRRNSYCSPLNVALFLVVQLKTWSLTVCRFRVFNRRNCYRNSGGILKRWYVAVIGMFSVSEIRMRKNRGASTIPRGTESLTLKAEVVAWILFFTPWLGTGKSNILCRYLFHSKACRLSSLESRG